MKAASHFFIRILVFILAIGFCATSRAQTATWTGASGGEWNTAGNWDIGVPGAGTNAVIPAASAVNYNSPMAAASFRTLTLSNALAVNTSNFVINETGAASTVLAIAAGGTLNIAANNGVTVTNAGGAVSVANGGTITVGNNGFLLVTNSTGANGFNVGASGNPATGGVLTIGSGATVTLDKLLSIAGVPSRVSVNGGTLNCLAGSGINESQNDGSQRIAVASGTANLGNFSVTRCNDASPAGGLLVTNGAVNATAIQIGTGNSVASSTVVGGTLTNTGIFSISDTTLITATSGDRKSYFHVRGGTVVSTGTNGIIIANQSNASSSPSAGGTVLGGVLDVTGGTLIAEKITLIRDNTIINAYASFTMSGGAVYLGSGGLVFNAGSTHIGRNLAFTGGTLGAKASWSSSAPFNIANTVTFKAADSANTPFNITLTGNITNSGSLTKTGGGVLTLSGNNTYGGNTIVSAGFLVLANANALPKGTALTLGSSGNAATLDLAGFNAQISSLATAGTAASQLITNSSAVNTSLLTFSNNAANSTFGGVIAGNKPVALTLLGGNLTLSGQNSYRGNLLISGGKLTLSGAGSTFSGSQIVLSNSAAALDVSGMGGITLGAGQSLSGYGGIVGGVSAANCPVSPGANGTAGTLTFSNSLALNGGVTDHFDLALDPNSAGNDLIVVGGALNVSGLNTIDVSPLGASLSAGTYKLIKCGSIGSGSAANFQVTGTLGASLQSAISVTATEVDLVVSQIGGTQRAWVGDGSANNWDHTTTNWLNGATPDVFNDGNFAVFDDTGASTPPVNLTTTLQPASVLVNATANYTFSGVGKISGTGTLVKTNSGALIILTTNNYSGVTTIYQGILQLGNGTASGAIGTNLVQNSGGALVLDLPGGNNFSNTIGGAGSLVQASSGTLTLTASNSYNGGTTISNGTLQLNTGAWFGSGNVTNNGTLIFNSSGNLTVGAVISGTGALTLANSGTVTLTGNNSYSGGTAVNKGTLLVNNSTGSGVGTGAVMVASGATLSGSGIIGGATTINSGGIFAPGNPTGTLTVSNNFTANNGAILNYTLGISSDKTVVSGNLNLSGTLNVTAGSGFTSATYPLFTYGGVLTLGSLTLALPANTSGSIDTNTPGLVNLVIGTLQTNIPAFPGALGFGAGATGARISGSVYHVTTLADSGAGSFRDAVSHSGRFIVFDVGGTITLNSVVSCSSGLTIAGQTAPGDGIAIIGHEVSFSARTNEIVRCLRIRPGSLSASGEDAINVGDGDDMVFDHCSLEFAGYNNIDAHGDVGSDAITVQNSIIGDPMSNGTSAKQGFGAHTEHVGGRMAWYYNLWVSEHNRQPLAKIDTIFVNNTEYNFQAGYTVADTSGKFRHDIINNYFITGPTDPSGGNAFYQMNANQTIYSTGNLRDNNNDGSLNGSAISPGGGGTVLTAPWSPLSTNTTVYSTAGAYRFDVSQTGALPRDQLDSLIFSQVKTLGNGPTGNGAGTAGPGGGLYYDQTSTGLGNNGYGVLTGGIAPPDSDQDGLPDYWELALGSNPNAADSLTPGTGGYTKLENYLNWLAAPHATAPKNSFVDVDLRQFTAGFTNASPSYSVLSPTNGTVALLADGHTAEFMAAGNFSGPGSFNFSVHASDGSALTNTVGVLVTATGLAQNLTWRGDGTLNNWDTTSTNWMNGTNRFTFSAGADTTFDDTGSNNPAINLVGALQPASVTVAADQNYTFSGGGSLNGSMVLSKDGAGTLTINTSNTFSGGTFLDGGTLTMGNVAANSYGLGTGIVTLGDGTRLNLFDAGAGPDAGTLPNSLVVSGSTTLELPERGGAGGATFTGDGVFNLINHYVRGNFNYDGSAFTGTFNALTPDGGADFRMGSYAGFPNATVNLSNNISAYFISTISPGGNTVDFGQINAVNSARLEGGPTGGRAVTLRIGGLGNDSSFAGAIVEQNTNSTTHLVKIGAGALTLGGANTYNGQTIVSNGTLVVNGSTGTNLLTVVNGMLAGNGAIGGGVTLQSGNAISPGTNIAVGNVGTLTVSNGLTLTNATLYFDLASSTTPGGGVNDLISLAGGALVLSGTNTVVPNLLNGFLAPGSYTLISGGNATSGGAANLVWAGATGTRQSFSFNTATPGTVLLNVAGSPPATLVWTGTNGGAWNVNGTVNWLNAGAADKFFDLDSVIFNDTSTNGTVVMADAVQPAQVVVSNSILNYSLGGGVLGGSGSLIKNDPGILTLGGSNSFSGGTFINGGIIILSNDVANQFGLGAGAVTLNGGTLTMHDDAATANAAGWNLVVPANATGTLNADSRCDLFGSLTGGGTLNFSVPSVNTTLYGDWSAFTGTVTVMGGGDFRVNNSSGYPHAAIVLSNNVNCYFSDVVDPNGTTLPIGALSGASSASLLGGATAGNVFTWQIGGQNTNATFAGTIAEQNTNAITAIEKTGTGTWTLTGNNTFSGGLTVSAGTLQVNNSSGSATGTNQLFVATGAKLSGNGSIGGLTVLDDGAILAPGTGGSSGPPSGTLTINNELDLSDLTVLQFGLGTNSDEVIVAGDLNSGGQLNITDIGGFGIGTYTLFTYGGTLALGNLAVAAAPAGFVYAISTNTPGQINLIVTRPQFNTISVGSNGIVMSGSGGPANGTFYLLGTTNVALPLNVWMIIATNQFDASGNFNFTNAISPNTPQSFYRLQLP